MKLRPRALFFSAFAAAAGLVWPALFRAGGPADVARAAPDPGAANDAPAVIRVGGIGAMLRAVTPPPAPPPPAEKGDLQLDGIYEQQTNVVVAGNRIHFYFYFMPDGHVSFGVPPGGTVHAPPTAEDQAALLKADPRRFGSYQVTGKQITLRLGTAGPDTKSFATGPGGNTDVIYLDNVAAVRRGRFKANLAFDGKYSAASSVEGGGAEARGAGAGLRASLATNLDFHADGTFSRQNFTALDSAGRGGAGRTDVAEGQSADRGKYQLSGNTLTLTFDNGGSRSFTVWPLGREGASPPEVIVAGGTVFSRSP